MVYGRPAGEHHTSNATINLFDATESKSHEIPQNSTISLTNSSYGNNLGRGLGHVSYLGSYDQFFAVL